MFNRARRGHKLHIPKCWELFTFNFAMTAHTSVGSTYVNVLFAFSAIASS